MNAVAFRHFFAYHFSANRTIWDRYIMSLSHEQFTRPVDYSMGSLRNQLVHLMSVDNAWFRGLRGLDGSNHFDPADFEDRNKLRACWDEVEVEMRAYLEALRDEMLVEKPFAEGEDNDLVLWQVLLHVANHGTDHRAQILRILHDLGCKTVAQDYIFYVFDNP